ncbi:Uncharacterized protein QTN25_001947 [Entamoeba marina]
MDINRKEFCDLLNNGRIDDASEILRKRQAVIDQYQHPSQPLAHDESQFREVFTPVNKEGDFVPESPYVSRTTNHLSAFTPVH